MGCPRLDGSLEALSSAGARRIYMADHEMLENYDLASIVQLARRHRPEIILMRTTAMGRELAPLVAANSFGHELAQADVRTDPCRGDYLSLKSGSRIPGRDCCSLRAEIEKAQRIT